MKIKFKEMDITYESKIIACRQSQSIGSKVPCFQPAKANDSFVSVFVRGRLQHKAIVMLLLCTIFFASANAQVGKLYIGTATADISPKLPIALGGQFELRIAHQAATPFSANVVALETRNGNQSVDQAIMVSCDLEGIPELLLKVLRDEVHRQMPDFDVKKIFLNAIHTHTGPVLLSADETPMWGYIIPKEGVQQVDEYRTFFVQRVAAAIVQAWKGRLPGSMTWGLSSAVIANNRRTIYADGSAKMYGNTNSPLFRGMEGIEDHDVNILFFWNQAKKLIAVNIEVPCPAQEVENDTILNADYWHPVRVGLRKRFGPDLCVLGWIGAGGDQSPHLMYRKAADDRMRKLRNLNRLDEIARRVVRAVDEAYDAVKDDRHDNVVLIHKVETLRLPFRLITDAECAEAKAISDEARAQIAANPKAADLLFAKMKWYGNIVTRFEKQKTDPRSKHEMEIHVLRIGDIALCTYGIEVFTDYGIQLQARSKALQTFIVEIAGPDDYYLPTEKAVKAGSYSAIAESNIVGPDSGQILVERTIELINSMWPEVK
ncbi:MAG: hypothetical protein M0Q53_09670 [Prolixibacteraceae bacterium]|nr:hypothetical protein [Prolixibacteraceae bacterium]